MSGKIVWLASYPKSGNTWLRSVYTALVRGDVDINALAAGAIHSGRASIDIALGVRSSDLSPEETEILRPEADDAGAARMTDDMWRKIHDALLPGPTGEPVVSPRATRAALYVVRDPRDVAVSLAHHLGISYERAVQRLGSEDSALFDDPSWLEPQLRQRLGTWSQHVVSWVDQPLLRVHVLRYEDCLTAPVETFGGAFAAAGLHRSEAELSEAVARASWERLQAQEEQDGFREGSTRGVRFFRKGKAGRWRDELAPGLARRVVDDHGAVMARFGYLDG